MSNFKYKHKRKVLFDRDKLRVRMQERGVSRKRLALLSGVGEATISRVISGYNQPTLGVINRLAWALDVNPFSFLVEVRGGSSQEDGHTKGNRAGQGEEVDRPTPGGGGGREAGDSIPAQHHADVV